MSPNRTIILLIVSMFCTLAFGNAVSDQDLGTFNKHARDHIYELDGLEYANTSKRNETFRLILTESVSEFIL